MKQTTYLPLFGAGLLWLLAIHCQPTAPAGPPRPADLLAYFKPMAAADTLLFEVEPEQGYTDAHGDTIPNALFFTLLDSALLNEIAHIADSSEALVLGLQRFPLNADVEACLVDIRQFWFQHRSLLLYDRRQQKFTARTTVAEWYGGDGGQVLVGSWLVDYNGDGHRDLVRREIQHALLLTEDGDARDLVDESAVLLLWQKDRFVEQPLSDTASVVKQFPIRSFW